jgi:DNA-binding response OmpR family regulator
VHRGADVREAVVGRRPDLVVLDLQIGHMGGMATCLDLRLEAGAGRAPDVPILMLLDRRPDVFLARRSGADGYLLKPLDPIRTRRAVAALLDGGTYADLTAVPATVEVPVPE